MAVAIHREIVCLQEVLTSVEFFVDCTGFVPLRTVIGLENSRHSVNQSKTKIKPTATWSRVFSHFSGRLQVCNTSSYRLLVIFFQLKGIILCFSFEALWKVCLWFRDSLLNFALRYGEFVTCARSTFPSNWSETNRNKLRFKTTITVTSKTSSSEQV